LLEKEGWPEKKQTSWLSALRLDYQTTELSAPDRLMLDYAMKLTVAPSSISAADIQALRESGFDDRAIHDICAITSYFAFVNRIADGLGVELDAYMQE
jgi:uncharacterized peroxidase-related enzyme